MFQIERMANESEKQTGSKISVQSKLGFLKFIPPVARKPALFVIGFGMIIYISLNAYNYATKGELLPFKIWQIFGI